MANTKPSKPRKGKARPSDCEHAAELARRYFAREPWCQIKVDGEIVNLPLDGDALAYELLDFARYGTFALPKSFPDLRARLVRGMVRHLCAEPGITAAAAIAKTAAAHGVSIDTVKNDLYGRKARAKRKT